MEETLRRLELREEKADRAIRVIRIALVISMCVFFSASIMIGGWYG